MPLLKLTYKGHKARWKDCERCALHQYRKQVVFARGTLPCDILFVGEAPGHSENVIGKPFIGPAGKLLDHMVNEALDGMELKLAFTNVLGCIPLDETLSKTLDLNPTSKKKQSEYDYMEKCSPKLTEFIKLAKPKGIVMVGTLAEHWTPTEGFTSEQVTSIYHPAYILRTDISQRGLVIQKTIIDLNSFFETVTSLL